MDEGFGSRRRIGGNFRPFRYFARIGQKDGHVCPYAVMQRTPRI